MPAVPLYLTWHQRYDNDRAHRWLRGQVREAIAAVFGEPGEPGALGASGTGS
ncbi:hypothetical protein [Streptomyces sp. IBSBF 2435]|uniref:hypothetical protein n=1 Tax=Streptomyces sp. IBSBF 2435 TaxID=2903531 RepID=UPI003FA70A81